MPEQFIYNTTDVLRSFVIYLRFYCILVVKIVIMNCWCRQCPTCLGYKCLGITRNKLYSHSHSCIFRVWKVSTWSFKRGIAIHLHIRRNILKHVMFQVWQLGSSTPNFTLEGHEKGVNCVDYYHGGDKPYLISGADDRLVKIWDYQNKTCVQTLEGHAQNISAG